MIVDPLKQDQWIRIINNFPSRCVQCGEWLGVGDPALWLKGLGIKHEECNVGLQPPTDETSLVILDEEDKLRLGLK